MAFPLSVTLYSTVLLYLQALSSVRPQEESMSPYSGSGLEGNINRSAASTVLNEHDTQSKSHKRFLIKRNFLANKIYFVLFLVYVLCMLH